MAQLVSSIWASDKNPLHESLFWLAHAGSKKPVSICWGSHWRLRSGYESLYPGWLKKQVGSLCLMGGPDLSYGETTTVSVSWHGKITRSRCWWTAPTGIRIAGMICLKLCSMSWRNQRFQSQLLARQPWERSWTLRSIARSSKTFGTCTATSTGASTELGVRWCDGASWA